VYPSDETLPPQGLYGAIVFTSQCAAILSMIDPSPALSTPGVIAFFGASDIPGQNLIGSDLPLYLGVGDEVQCVGAPVGVVIATSDEIANHAAALVNLTYTSNGKTPITNLTESIAQQQFFDVGEIVCILNPPPLILLSLC
jgi:xanthine dehydrogenase/oxidase